ncbi:hypothetical protein [Aminobacter ciceronei]|jgi:hypothetical protein|uniref:hypothetical protein n=1 Tax=Aminobacter ciceronei TaxID=150723 RepID=UPI003F72AB06
MTRDDDSYAALEGRIRAIESLLLSLPLSDEQFASARQTLRSNAKAKGKLGDLQEKLAGSNKPLDEYGELALSELAYRHQKSATS